MAHKPKLLYVAFLRPDMNSKVATSTVAYLQNNTCTYIILPLLNDSSRLLFDYNLQCDEHYYDKCDRYCMPDPVRYICSSFGRPVCNPGEISFNSVDFRNMSIIFAILLYRPIHIRQTLTYLK